ncbi:unnamed protein product [Amoebophrya sp. A25]|nr:unnamed protein product [Amoebophrya sp. A25]|eukprot:GSA25T00018489001.1
MVFPDTMNGKMKNNSEDVCRYWFLESPELSSEIGELLKTIDETSKFLEASMDARRNQLLRMEVTLDVVAVVFSFGALVSGIFGMNLKSGMEETLGMFPAVIALICLVGCPMALGCAAYYVRNKRHRAYHRIYKRRCSLYYSNSVVLSSLFMSHNVEDDQYFPGIRS